MNRGSRERWYGWVAIAVTLLALGAAVLWGRRELREQMRSQIISRDAVILQALVQQEQLNPSPEVDGFDPREPAYQWGALLRIASLTNIIALRLFKPDGEFDDALPVRVDQTQLPSEVLTRLQAGEAVVRFIPALPRAELFLELPNPERAEPATLPCVEISVPLQAPKHGALTGIAQFLLEGLSAQREFDRLDQRVDRQSLLVFGVGATLTTVIMSWAFRKLQQTNALLAARTTDLRRANQELAEAAKVTAVGAVAAHLIHGLRNPVAGLQSFVVARQEEAGAEDGEEWREALAATRRMQAMIQSVVEVLRESETAPAYSIPFPELVEAVFAVARPLASRTGIRLAFESERAEHTFDNHTAGILKLILSNLIQNAIQASPENGVVTLRADQLGEQLRLEIADCGGGIPEEIRPRLFQPVRSTKEGGSGIGLAISRQLAAHLGAELRLAVTSDQGTRFELRLPRTGRLT